jgi:DNA-binding NtrC family response regulator
MKKKILFVDDEKNLLDSLKRNLRSFSEQWSMEFTDSAKAAIGLLNNGEYDIIVSDYKMPEMDGLELLKIVKEKYPGTKRILLTGQSDTEIYDISKEIVDLYISKPCDHNELVSLLTK